MRISRDSCKAAYRCKIQVYRVDAIVRQERYIEYEYWESVPADNNVIYFRQLQEE